MTLIEHVFYGPLMAFRHVVKAVIRPDLETHCRCGTEVAPDERGECEECFLDRAL